MDSTNKKPLKAACLLAGWCADVLPTHTPSLCVLDDLVRDRPVNQHHKGWLINNNHMELYTAPSQKSSDLNYTDEYYPGYGLSFSAAVAAVRAGMASHVRFYEAAIRLRLTESTFTAADFLRWLNQNGVTSSSAQVYRALTDRRLFTVAGFHRTGGKGRPTRLFRLVPPEQFSASLGIPFGARHDAPYLLPEYLASTVRYTLAIFARWLDTAADTTRNQQVKEWGLTRQTIIRRTRLVSTIAYQYERTRSDNFNKYQAFINWDDVFLADVRKAVETGSRKFFLEVTTRAGEIIRVPCRRDIAADWLSRSVVVICQQLHNHYTIHDRYRNPTFDLPF